MQMKRFLFAVLSAFLPFLAFGQMMPDSTVQVCAYWQKGDRAVYECKSTTVTIDKDGNEKTTQASSETRIFDVIDATEHSFVLQTSYKDVFNSNMSLGVGADVFSKVAEGIVIKTQTNEFGTVQGLVNVEELTEALKQTIPLSVDAALARQDKKALKELGLTREGLIDTYTEQLCRPETITMACLDDVLPLLFYHGTRLSLKDEYTVKQELHNPFPNTTGTIQVDMHFWVDEEQSDSSFVVIRSFFEAYDETMMPFIRESAVTSALTAAPEHLSADKVEEEVDRSIAESHTRVSMKQYTATVVHLDSGWTTEWWSKRIVTKTDDDGETKTVVEREVTLVDE
jgi:hypothetical protein